jgi:hypothetical protein
MILEFFFCCAVFMVQFDQILNEYCLEHWEFISFENYMLSLMGPRLSPFTFSHFYDFFTMFFFIYFLIIKTIVSAIGKSYSVFGS